MKRARLCVLVSTTVLWGTGMEVVAATFKDEAQNRLSVTPTIINADYFPHVVGQALADLDGDGDLDIFVTNGSGRPNYLFINDGTGKYSDVARQSGVDLTEFTCTTAGVADIDGDGRLDIMIGRQAESGKPGHPLLLRNMGNSEAGIPQFTDVSDKVGLSRLPVGFRALGFTFSDLDEDGDLDVYMAGFDLTYSGDVNLPLGTSTPNILMRNDIRRGKTYFTDVTSSAGVAGEPVAGRTKETQSVQWFPHTWVVHTTDVNHDGRMDLMALNDAPGKIDIFLNRGGLKFEPLKLGGVTEAGGWMGVASADFNQDGFIDHFLTNLGGELIGLDVPSEINLGSIYESGGTSSHKLLIGSASGVLADVGSAMTIERSAVLPPRNVDIAPGLAPYEFGWGAVAIDADNTGRSDIYWVGASYEGMPFNGIGRFLKNMGGNRWADKTLEYGLFNTETPENPSFDSHLNGYSVLDGDIDNDGDLDLVVVNGGDGASRGEGGVRILINQGTQQQSGFDIELREPGRNVYGVGARVTVYANAIGHQGKHWRSPLRLRKASGQLIEKLSRKREIKPVVNEVVTSGSAFSGKQPRIHVGIGKEDAGVHLVKVEWASGGQDYYLATGNSSIIKKFN